VQTDNSTIAIQEQKTLLANAQTAVLAATSKQNKMVQDIEVLTLSFRDYTNKLDRVQKYSGVLADACQVINTVLSQPDENMSTQQALVSHIIDMLENFVVWFEFTYNSKLYEFTCVLLHSQLELS